VLYIDDLDRCPPDRVFEVLQAIHLLLAFELFVVVVAVDSRWLSRSLLSHYSALLGAEHRTGNGDGRATPDDYLEKIFQIPFHVRPIDEQARGRIVFGLLRGAIDTEHGESDAGFDTGIVAKNAVAPVRDRFDRGATTDRGAMRDTQAMPDLNPASLRITRDELRLMAVLRPVLGRTPRAVKRFVNVYRLIRSIADARGEPFLESATDGSAPPYEAAMFLLAVVTGLPAIATDIFRAAAAAGYPGAAGAADARTLGELVRHMEANAGNDDEHHTAARRLARWLASDAAAGWRDRELSDLAAELERVSRFSFRSELGLEV
jgi:hypothetical protein